MSLPTLEIAVASGKGGTGKTTVAVGLALVAGPCRLLDCDVEEPNAHLFLRPAITEQEAVSVPVPVVDPARCTRCGRCAEACRFHAIAVLGRQVMVFPELCHGCGACGLACPAGAITEEPRAIGAVESGASGPIQITQGRLNVGEPMATPVIRAVKAHRAASGLTLVDAAPGTACPVVAAVRGSDFCLLVTEPTPFGESDLAMALAVMAELGTPCGVVVNRAGGGEEGTVALCESRGVPVLGRLPFDRAVAAAYAQGRHPVEAVAGFGQRLEELLAAVVARAGQERR